MYICWGHQRSVSVQWTEDITKGRQVLDAAKKYGFFFFLSIYPCAYGRIHTCRHVSARVCRCLWRLEVDVRSLPQFLFHLIHWSRIFPSNPEVAIRLVPLASLLWAVITSGPPRLPDSCGFQRSELQFFFLCRKCFNHQTSWFLSVGTMLVSRRQVLTFWS